MMQMPRITGAFALIVLATLLVVQTTAQDAATCESRIERDTYYSARLGQTMYYTAYLPPCYDAAGQSYPVLHLMHGSNENDEHWLRLGLREELDRGIAAGVYPPLVVLMPFGNIIANRNRFDRASWGNIFINEYLPTAEGRYRVDSSRRAIGGISRGGFWAYQIGLQHPQMFTAIGGHSAFFDEFHAPPEHNPLDLALNAPDINSLHLMLDRGADDFAAPGLELMHERLNQRGLTHTYTVHPQGQHNNAYWREHIADYIAFYVQDWHEQPAQAAQPLFFATNTPAARQATPTATPTAAATRGYDLFVPVVAFPSLQTSISTEALQAVYDGGYDARLRVDASTRDALMQHGVKLHPDTRISDNIDAALWRDRQAYALLPFDRLTTRLRVLWPFTNADADADALHPIDQLERYAFAFDSPTPNYQPDKLTRLTLSGVTALTRNTLRALDEQPNGVEWAAAGIAAYVQRSDFLHISNEVSFHPQCPQSIPGMLGGNSSFCSKQAHFALFDLLNVDIVELSGNHNNDYGYDAYHDTLAWYDERNISTVGGGTDENAARAPLIIEHGDNTLAMLSCNAVGPYYALANNDPNLLGGVRPGAAACDWAWLEAELPALAASAQIDVVVVSVQHEEYEVYQPTDAQRVDFRRLANLGADVVVGTAPHKPQTYEYVATSRGTTALLHYGMGNLYFDQPFWGNMRFFMNTLLVYEGRLLTLDVFPGIIDGDARPRLMTPDERENFLFFIFVQEGGM